MKTFTSILVVFILVCCSPQNPPLSEFHKCDTTKYILSLFSYFENESKQISDGQLFDIHNDTTKLSDLALSNPILIYLIKTNSCLSCVQKNLLVLKEHLNTSPNSPVILVVESNHIREIYSYYVKYELKCQIYLAKPQDQIFRNLDGDGEMLFLLDSALRVNLFFEPVYQEPKSLKHYLISIDNRIKNENI